MKRKTSRLKGLSVAEVHARIQEGRTNRFTQESSRSAWSIIRANTLTLFNGIIFTCLVILLTIGRWQDALFGFSAFLNALIGSWQEFRAKQSLDKLALLNAPHARVIRSSKQQEINVADVVEDDMLVLRAGDQVPADAVVVESINLQLDESMLTGESDPVDKTVDAEILSGSIVIGGTGHAQVVRVGADSFANRFASEAKRFSLVASELRESINTVLRWVSWFIGPIIVLVLNSQMVALGGWQEAIASGVWQSAVVATIASVVATIPLGLILLTSISFAVAAVKLAKEQVLVQELPAVEGLARVTTICLDKTGTLTEGDIVFDAAHQLGVQKLPWREVLAWYGVQADANATARCLAAAFDTVPDVKAGAQIAFSSARKWSAVYFPAGTIKGSWVMGGPEMVFPAKSDSMSKKERDELMATVLGFASSGLRTLVLAHAPSELDVKGESLPQDCRPVALVTFKEQIRSDAKETLAYFAKQGVAVKIISGDNPETVAAIARRVGLDAPSGFDARELPESDEALAAVLEREIVFGRVTPEQKKRLVMALKAAGHAVAMTGDGVNDTLAIKEADMGIAMNSGSAATKAVARLVLLDGKFSHLPRVVDEGRQVIANIERVSMLFLSKTSYAIGLAVVFGILMMPFPFLPRQLSMNDALSIGFPAFFLAMLANRQPYRPGFLKRSLSFAVPTGIIVTAALAIYSYVASGLSIPQAEIRTGSTLLLTIIGIWVLVILSRPVTVLKTGIVGLMMALLVAVYSVPFARSFLQFTDVSGQLFVLITMAAALSIAAIEVVRFVHVRLFALRVERRKRPFELGIVVVMTYISAYASILMGILLMAMRYSDGVIGNQPLRFAVTLAGAIVVLAGFLAIALASGIARGDKVSRTIVTGLAVLSAANGIWFALSATDGAMLHWVTVLINIGMVAALWQPRAQRYFSRT